ncbi:hypothetical protein O0L34_g9344 [Tuta absoluta]|nr:hypothetical protein O0L34_g9344 [Tuta absoluta]
MRSRKKYTDQQILEESDQGGDFSDGSDELYQPDDDEIEDDEESGGQKSEEENIEGENEGETLSDIEAEVSRPLLEGAEEYFTILPVLEDEFAMGDDLERHSAKRNPLNDDQTLKVQHG